MFTILDIVLEADADSCDILQQRIRAFAEQEDPKQPHAPRFLKLAKIPQLHFMSMQVFEDRHYDPLLVFENNFDGDPSSYWDGVLSQIGDQLRSIFAYTKAAHDPSWSRLFTPSSTDSLKDFILAHAISPSAGHIGAPGMPIQRIQRDRLFSIALEQQLDGSPLKYKGKAAVEVHHEVRSWALSRYEWLGDTREQSQASAARAGLTKAIAILVIIVAFLATLAIGTTKLASHLLHISVAAVLATVLVPAGIALLLSLKSLRRLESTDLKQDHPQVAPDRMEEFASQEDKIVQNHLASMVLVKPGILRGFTARAALRALKMLVPFMGWDGSLGSMRTIHFAHWTLVGNNGRLLFLSNFDGSWQSYLDDFVDKAHGGLTLAWSNCIGFPETRFLYFDGATHGVPFKSWARQSQTQSLFWYSAYSDLTVNQIIRNAAIVDGLRKPSLTPSDAEKWAALL